MVRYMIQMCPSVSVNVKASMPAIAMKYTTSIHSLKPYRCTWQLTLKYIETALRHVCSVGHTCPCETCSSLLKRGLSIFSLVSHELNTV
jgi:hypothetical protein